MRVTRNLPAFQGVAANSTARCELPPGRRYHSVDLAIGTLANVGEIRVLVNGQQIHRYTAAQLDALNQFKGLTAAGATSSVLRIMFDRYGMWSPQQSEATALNTGVADGRGLTITSLSIECDIGGTTTTISGTSETSFSQAVEQHIFLYRRTFTESLISGENQIDSLPYQSSRELAVEQIAFIPSANDFASLKIEKNNTIEFERSKALNERIQSDGSGLMARVPQSGYVIVDRTERGSAINAIPLQDATDFRVRATTTGAMTATIIYDTLGALQG